MRADRNLAVGYDITVLHGRNQEDLLLAEEHGVGYDARRRRTLLGVTFMERSRSWERQEGLETRGYGALPVALHDHLEGDEVELRMNVTMNFSFAFQLTAWRVVSLPISLVLGILVDLIFAGFIDRV